MRRYPSLFIFSSLFIFTNISHAGIGNIGNGGDVVVCSFKNNSFTFSLDYLIADERYQEDKKIIAAPTLQKATQRLAAVIAAKVPSLLPSFTEFFQALKNKDISKKYVWIDSENLPDIDDENVGNLNRNICDRGFYAAQVKQAFIRKVISKGNQELQVQIHYDRHIYAWLTYKNPTQLSFLLVHEWLWDLNSDVAQNRNINYFLHSKNIEKMDAADVTQKLVRLGLEIPN